MQIEVQGAQTKRVLMLVLWGDSDPFIDKAFAETFGAQTVVHYPPVRALDRGGSAGGSRREARNVPDVKLPQRVYP